MRRLDVDLLRLLQGDRQGTYGARQMGLQFPVQAVEARNRLDQLSRRKCEWPVRGWPGADQRS